MWVWKEKKLFSFEYIINNNLLKHDLEFSDHFKLIKEKLFIFEKINNEVTEWKTIFENYKDYCLLWRVATISEYEEKITFKFEEKEVNLINNLFLFIKNIEIFDNVFGVYEHHHLTHNLKKIFKSKNDKSKQELKNLKILIKAVDPNIIDLQYHGYDDDIIAIVKDKNNKEIKVPFENISEGTKRFLYLMPRIMNNDKNKIYIIDEIENSFHPRIIDTILRIFYYNQNNPNNSQLLFTTHNPYIFDIAKIHNNCINVSLYNQNNNFEKLSNSENYGIKRNDKLFSKNYILEIINSHPDSDSIDEIYNRFTKKY
ncbi:ATP-binding protein [Spiroplasma endosymbiont of Colias croceus]|uniref:AAA family ATPase n=1 Tax=Spiroplasma endosymbiont of Colias croceus TaxID=3066310 RepID=UPI0030CF6B2A